MSRSYMALDSTPDNEGPWPAVPESTGNNNVHYLFSVRNMFFSVFWYGPFYLRSPFWI